MNIDDDDRNRIGTPMPLELLCLMHWSSYVLLLFSSSSFIYVYIFDSEDGHHKTNKENKGD